MTSMSSNYGFQRPSTGGYNIGGTYAASVLNNYTTMPSYGKPSTTSASSAYSHLGMPRTGSDIYQSLSKPVTASSVSDRYTSVYEKTGHTSDTGRSGYLSDYKSKGSNSNYASSGYQSDHKSSGTSDYGRGGYVSDYGKHSFISDSGRRNYFSSLPRYKYLKKKTGQKSTDYFCRPNLSENKPERKELHCNGRLTRSDSNEESTRNFNQSSLHFDPNRKGGKATADFTSESEITNSEQEEEEEEDEEEEEEEDEEEEEEEESGNDKEETRRGKEEQKAEQVEKEVKQKEKAAEREDEEEEEEDEEEEEEEEEETETEEENETKEDDREEEKEREKNKLSDLDFVNDMGRVIDCNYLVSRGTSPSRDVIDVSSNDISSPSKTKIYPKDPTVIRRHMACQVSSEDLKSKVDSNKRNFYGLGYPSVSYGSYYNRSIVGSFPRPYISARTTSPVIIRSRKSDQNERSVEGMYSGDKEYKQGQENDTGTFGKETDTDRTQTKPPVSPAKKSPTVESENRLSKVGSLTEGKDNCHTEKSTSFSN